MVEESPYMALDDLNAMMAKARVAGAPPVVANANAPVAAPMRYPDAAE